MTKKNVCAGLVRAEVRRLRILQVLRAFGEVAEWKTDDWFISTALRDFEEYGFSRDQVRADLTWLGSQKLISTGEETVMFAQLTESGCTASLLELTSRLLSEGRDLIPTSLKVLQALGKCVHWKSNELCITRALRGSGENVSRDQVRGYFAWLGSRGFVTIAQEILMTAELIERGSLIAAGCERMRGIAKAA
jgi:hypothetical protein